MYAYNYGLLSGLSGSALFLHEYSRVDKSYEKHVAPFIDQTFASIEQYAPYATYCAGLSGACIGINFVCRNYPGLQEPYEFVSEEIDDYILEEYRNCIAENNLDFLHGAVGMGFYYLERLRDGAEKYREHINLLLTCLEEHAIKADNKIKWHQKAGQTYGNISLAHGMSSIVILFSGLLQAGGDYNVDVKGLLYGAVNYILDQEIDPGVYNSLFPYASKERDMKGSRLAWCYGDLGIAIGLLKAAEALANNDMRHKALQIFDYCATRRDLVKNMVLDTSICHGTAGIAIIYHDLYRKTGEKRYQETSSFWIGQTLQLYEAGKMFYVTEQNQYDTRRLSVLEGKAGVGLAILSVCSEIPSDWTRLLLI